MPQSECEKFLELAHVASVEFVCVKGRRKAPWASGAWLTTLVLKLIRNAGSAGPWARQCTQEIQAMAVLLEVVEYSLWARLLEWGFSRCVDRLSSVPGSGLLCSRRLWLSVLALLLCFSVFCSSKKHFVSHRAISFYRNCVWGIMSVDLPCKQVVLHGS